MASRRTRAGLAAAVAASAALVGGVVAQPGASAAPPPDAVTGLVWQISRQGQVVALSQQCTGLGSRSEVVEFRSGGAPDVSKTPGTLRSTDVTCAFGLTGDRELYDWRVEVESGVPGAASPAELVLLDQSGSPVQTWVLQRAWPSQYLVGPDRTVVTLTNDRAVLQ